MLQQILPVVPVMLVIAAACVVLLTGFPRRESEDVPVVALSAIGVSSALIASALLWYRRPDVAGLIAVDAYALFFTVALCVLGLLTLLTASLETERSRVPRAGAGRHALLLLSLAGMMIAAAARDLVVIFLAIEVAWLGTVVLAGVGRHDEGSTEAAFKALTLGAFSGAFLLYGIALVYAVTGTTRLDELSARIAASSLDPHILMLVAMVLLLVGFAFLISAVPFHMCTPDISRGADARVAGFVTTGLRLAGCAAFLRVLLTAFEPLRIDWLPVLSAIAGLTMIVGAVVAVGQSSVRRLVAYVGVAHTGFLLVGLLAASPAGKAAVLFSVVAWAAANTGAFTVMAVLTRSESTHDELRDFAGLGYERPGVAALLTVCLLSLAGLPPLAGFAGKWFVFAAALQEGFVALAVLGALTSVVLAFACLRLVVQMYMTDRPGARRRPVMDNRAIAGLVVVAAALVYAGLWPGPLLAAAVRSVASIF